MTEQMMYLVIQLGVIIFAAYTGGLVARRMRLPSVLGELLAGTIIGPFLLGGIPLPGLPHGLFEHIGSFPISPELYGFTTVASILLLFMVGLETDLKLFVQFSLAGSLVGLGGALVSFLFGNITTVWFAEFAFGVAYPYTHSVPLFLGVISAATSVGISARILSERHKMDSPEGVTILAGAVIDDILGIILLVVVLGIHKSGHVEWSNVALVGGKSIGIWLGFSALGLALSRKISFALKSSGDSSVFAILSFGMALILAGVFEEAGLAMIIGAYVAGLSLSQTDVALAIRDEFKILHNLFIPVFFCVMGMLVDFRSMASVSLIIFGLAYTLTAVLAKLVGCSVPCLFLNFNMRGALRVGLGMIPRGEVALIIAGIGMSAGALGREAFGAAMMMTFLTTLVTPLVLERVLRSNLPTTRTPVKSGSEHIQITYQMPARDSTLIVLGRIRDALRYEGFYIHLVDLTEELYQAHRESMVLSFRVKDNLLEFAVSQDQRVFVDTLMFDILSELETSINRLKSCVTPKEIGKRILGSDAVKSGQPSTKQFLEINPHAIVVNLHGNSKSEILSELLDTLVFSGDLDDVKKGEALEDLLEREKTMSTGMQDGIALPHAKTDAVDHIMCALGVKPDGVDFQSLDGKPSRIFVAVLTPPDSPGYYLQFVATVSKILSDPQNREFILKAKSNWEIFEFLSGKNRLDYQQKPRRSN